MFKLGVEYSGIELFTDYQLVLELTVDFPTGGPEGSRMPTGMKSAVQPQ